MIICPIDRTEYRDGFSVYKWYLTTMTVGEFGRNEHLRIAEIL